MQSERFHERERERKHSSVVVKADERFLKSDYCHSQTSRAEFLQHGLRCKAHPLGKSVSLPAGELQENRLSRLEKEMQRGEIKKQAGKKWGHKRRDVSVIIWDGFIRRHPEAWHCRGLNEHLTDQLPNAFNTLPCLIFSLIRFREFVWGFFFLFVWFSFLVVVSFAH